MLPPDQIAARIAEKFGDAAILASKFDGHHPWISVPSRQWLDIAAFLRNDSALRLDLLRSITGIDYPDKQQIAASYDLLSFDHRHEFCVKVFVPRDKPEIPSAASIWKAADWHERETYDLLGINFTDHPDSVMGDDGRPHPRRILLPDDWKGFPLRKDYVFPREYQGIPGSVEIEWAQKSEYPK